jgi:energy-coupling factor transport system ATP-binding protein
MRDWGKSLSSAGVWVPQVSELATSLAAHGAPLDPFPLTVGEAIHALRPMAAKLAPGASPKRPSSVGKAFVEVDELSFSFANAAHAVLTNVSLVLRSHELVAIVGGNGAGKTTLARNLVRILRPPPGRVRLEGFDLTRLTTAEVARRLGYVFQYPEHQFVGRSVLEDVAFGLRRAGQPELDALRLAQAMLHQFGLGNLALAHPYSLSHGEQRRLSVAAMLVLGQRGLILDEPTFGQDRNNADLLLDKLAALARDNHAIVTITHDMRMVAERAERAIAMAGGQVIFDGPPASLFADEALLRRAHLRPPPLFELGQRLGLFAPWLRISDVVDAFGHREVLAG